MQYYKAIQIKKFDDVFESLTPSLGGIKKELGDIVTKAILSIILIDLVKFFNIGKSMDDEQVAQTIEMIQDEFYMLKPEDLKLCFSNAKKGKYGKVYDRLDGQIIIEWLTTYFNDRTSYSAEKSFQKHDKLKYENESIRYEQEKIDRKKDQEITKISTQHYIDNLKKQKHDGTIGNQL